MAGARPLGCSCRAVQPRNAKIAGVMRLCRLRLEPAASCRLLRFLRQAACRQQWLRHHMIITWL